MWLSVESVEKESDIVISAGNTGALLVIAKLNLKMIENIDKLLYQYTTNKRIGVVLDLGANIECSSKNLVDFLLEFSLYNLYPLVPNVALLNMGSEELKEMKQ